MGGGGNKMNGAPLEDSAHSMATSSKGEKNDKKKKEAAPQASMAETLDFAFQCGPRVKCLFLIGCITGVLNGLVYPALAYLFSSSFSDLSAAGSEGLANVRSLAFSFLYVGTYALVMGLLQSWCFELVAYEATQNFRLQWFSSLLRQDTSYFDVHDAGGIAGQVGPSSNKYRRGVGRKFGEGIQFLTTGVGGIACTYHHPDRLDGCQCSHGILHAPCTVLKIIVILIMFTTDGFYASWQVAFVILSVIPFASITAIMVMKLNQSKSTRQAAAYKSAGSIAYSAVSSIKTVVSLNAVQTMINHYSEATQEAYDQATAILLKQGFWNGERRAQ